ncbi:MAG: MFS transporter [Planctomycetes bacterium]|nr:MFS transporter [Planctomycetota bacterium]
MTTAGRYIILSVAFLGWLFAGFHMSITQLTGQSAAIDLLGRAGELDGEQYRALSKQTKDELSAAQKEQLGVWKATIGQWFAWIQCAFLFGAAAGGLVFGKLGDVIGRSKAMAASIVMYTAFAAATALAQSPFQFWALWFLACTGVGGMWPNGVALVSEAWSGMSRPMVAGVIGVAANIGIFLFATLAAYYTIRFDHWRWAMYVGAAPIVLGVVAFVIVPESPRWLTAKSSPAKDTMQATSDSVFRPPLLGVTLVAIVLATVPMIGGWGTANWMNPWSEQVGDAALKANVLQARSFTGVIGSLLGGWIASLLGRRQTYFLVSLFSLGLAQYMFGFMVPTDHNFLYWVAALGFVSGVYFGWLPLCLPELFPTRHRATGAGVGFNFGRIVTAVTIFGGGALMHVFEGDYARIGRLTSLLFLVGMIAIWFAPDTSGKQLDD